MAARSIQTTDQFKHTLSETDRRKIFIERMERKLAVKQALRRSQRRYLRRNWPFTRPNPQTER